MRPRICKQCGELTNTPAKGLCNSCYCKLWKSQNKERVSEYRKEWNANNPEKCRQYRDKWSLENPEKSAAATSKSRRFRRLAIQVSRNNKEYATRGAVGRISGLDIQYLKLWQNNRCLYPGCSKQVTPNNPITLDHIVPLSRGGANEITNMQLLCRSHNSQKWTKADDYRTAEMKLFAAARRGAILLLTTAGSQPPKDNYGKT